MSAACLAHPPEQTVARLLTDQELHARIAADFEDGARLSFNMAPPFLPGRTTMGRPRKRAFPAWIMLPVLQIFARLKSLRGTSLDLFGYSRERRAERRMISDYEALVERTLARLTAGNVRQAAALIRKVESVRGYGPVKAEAMIAYEKEAELAERDFLANDKIADSGLKLTLV